MKKTRRQFAATYSLGTKGRLMGIKLYSTRCMNCEREFRYFKNFKKHKCKTVASSTATLTPKVLRAAIKALENNDLIRQKNPAFMGYCSECKTIRLFNKNLVCYVCKIKL